MASERVTRSAPHTHASDKGHYDISGKRDASLPRDPVPGDPVRVAWHGRAGRRARPHLREPDVPRAARDPPRTAQVRTHRLGRRTGRLPRLLPGLAGHGPGTPLPRRDRRVGRGEHRRHRRLQREHPRLAPERRAGRRRPGAGRQPRHHRRDPDQRPRRGPGRDGGRRRRRPARRRLRLRRRPGRRARPRRERRAGHLGPRPRGPRGRVPEGRGAGRRRHHPPARLRPRLDDRGLHPRHHLPGGPRGDPGRRRAAPPRPRRPRPRPSSTGRI